MRLVSIDPNVKRMALAVWEDGELVKTYYLRSDLKGAPHTYELLLEMPGALGWVDQIAIESQQIYARDGLKKAGSLIKLAQYAGAAVGALFCEGCEVTYYLPRVWKGQVPKDVMLPRIQEKLTALELTKVVDLSKTYEHDIWDAVGIGLYHLGRMKK